MLDRSASARRKRYWRGSRTTLKRIPMDTYVVPHRYRWHEPSGVPEPRKERAESAQNSSLRLAGGEEHGRQFLLGRIDVPQDHDEQRHEHGRDRDREEHGPAAEEQPDRRHGDEHEERREADGVTEDLRHPTLFLEQALFQ